MAKPERARPVITDLVTGQVTAEDLDQPAPPVRIAVTFEAQRQVARALRPPEGEVCRACWLAGRDAVIGTQATAHSIVAEHHPGADHNLRAFQRGADAARAVFTP